MKKIIAMVAVAAVLCGCNPDRFAANSKSERVSVGDKIALDWRLGWSKSADGKCAEFIPATVPGSAQLDIAKAKNYPDYRFGTNADQFRWTEDVFFTYRTVFDKPLLSRGQRLVLNGKGIDYKYAVLLNGQKIHAYEGMFKGFQLDITDQLKASGNVLEIRINPVPKAFPEKKFGFHSYRTNASKSAKPAVSYGWDWHPRLIPSGVWDDLNLEVRNASNLTYSALLYKMGDDLKSANLTLELEGENIKGCTYFWELLDMDGKCAVQQSGAIDADSVSIDEGAFMNPELWWTHDHGKPYLYTFKLTLLSPEGKKLETRAEKVGFRRVRLVMNEGAWEKPQAFPVNQCAEAPMQIELNGRRIFAKGSNWANPEVFFSELDRARYEPLVKFAKDAHFNIFRIWGGAIVNKDSFFDLCNEYGILVWQEFPLACNYYPDDPSYVSVLKSEAEAIVKRIRKNPCIAIWGGGNELFCSWSRMSSQSIPLRMLNAVCLELDGGTPFMYTSPLNGVGHGQYFFVHRGSDAFKIFSKCDMVAYTEFGVNGIASLAALKSCIPEKELWPIEHTPSWEAHHAFMVFDKYGWLRASIVEKFCGKAKSLEDLIEKSQFMQAQGYKALFEEARRQKPHCSMAVNWDYNEAWPAAAGNALVEYPATPKPAFFAVKESCRPVMLSAKVLSFDWERGAEIPVDIWLLNDTFAKVSSGKVLLFIKADGKETLVGEFAGKTTVENRNVKIVSTKIKLPEIRGDRFAIVVKSASNPEFNSEYGFVLKGAEVASGAKK